MRNIKYTFGRWNKDLSRVAYHSENYRDLPPNGIYHNTPSNMTIIYSYHEGQMIVSAISLEEAREFLKHPNNWGVLAIMPSKNIKHDIDVFKIIHQHNKFQELDRVFYVDTIEIVNISKFAQSSYINEENTLLGKLKAEADLSNQIANVEFERNEQLQSNIKDIELERQTLAIENEELREEIRRLSEKQGRSADGYVYLLKVVGQDNLYKIGRTANPDNRLKTFSVKLPFLVEYEHLIPTDDMYQLERELHGKFSRQRKRNSEFFTLDEADVSYIKSL